MERPILDRNSDSKILREFYFLKEELVDFCRKNGLPASGGKMDIVERIARFLDTGEIMPTRAKKAKAKTIEGTISLNDKIGPDFVCTEKHRAFFKEHIGASFSFNVAFQKWLKSNADKTYLDAVAAYRKIIDEKKNGKTPIDGQFEYNTYIRDFFADNRGKTLGDAIKCWKYKKQMQGHNRYERIDLAALE